MQAQLVDLCPTGQDFQATLDLGKVQVSGLYFGLRLWS
jgi:hypothetical protein